MASLVLSVSTGEVTVNATTKTFLTAKAPTNQRIKIRGIELFGKSASSTDTPVKVEMGLVTTDGQTAAASAITPVPLDGDLSETPQGAYYKNYTAEPTSYGSIFRTWEIAPTSGIVVHFNDGLEIVLKGGTELGIRLTSSQIETLSLNLLVEE